MTLDLRKNRLILRNLIIPCRMIRSDRRSLGIEIRRCPEGGAELLIRAPRRMRMSDIEWFMNQKEQWITEKYQAAMVDKPEPERVPIPEYVSKQWLQTEGAARFQQKIAGWAERRDVTYGRVTIRDQKTRWGSCSSRGNLNFNWRLLLMPEDVMDYVVVHELAHRREMNHSSAFWKIVETYLPDYRIRRQWLKENGIRYSGPVQLTETAD